MRIKRLTKYNINRPQRETEGAAGYDLRAVCGPDPIIITPGDRKLIDTGFAWEIPEGMVGLVRPRSGMAVRQGVDVLAGVIDSDYRGEVKVLLLNTGNDPVKISTDDRIAQMVVVLFHGSELVEVDDLDDSDRGAGGFGSTGVD